MGFIQGFIYILSVAGVLVTTPAPASYVDKAGNIEKELVTRKAAHALLIKKTSSLNAELSALKGDLVDISKKLRESEEALSASDQKLKDLREKKDLYTKDLYAEQQAMGGLISAMKKFTRASTPDLLVRGEPVDAARASLLMKSMGPQIREQSEHLTQKLNEISKIEQEIEKQVSLQKRESKQLNKQQDKLSSLVAERKKIYQQTESERIQQEKEVARLSREAKNLEDLMAKIKARDRTARQASTARAVPLPDNMLTPVAGGIHTAFGQKDDLGAESKGITFSTRRKASVISPLAGTVKFAGAFQKYKQILIVEHPGGYHSLIAGLGRIDTVAGAKLTAGEPVGAADDVAEPQVYYELRQNGKPINPQKLLIAQRKQEKS